MRQEDVRFDSTLALFRDPYRFIERCRQFGTDLFQTRLLLRRTICMTGPDAAEFFYRTDLFSRRGAAPGALRRRFSAGGECRG